VRSHETPRTESDKHYDQNKANVWAGTAVVNLKAKILVNSLVYHSKNKRNGGHQTLPLGWVQNRLKISRIMVGIAKRVEEFGAESIQCKKGLTIAYTTCTVLFGHSTFFVASLVFTKGTWCSVIRRNFRCNWAVRSCYGKVLQVIGLHDFRCYLHVASWSLTPICHVFMIFLARFYCELCF